MPHPPPPTARHATRGNPPTGAEGVEEALADVDSQHPLDRAQAGIARASCGAHPCGKGPCRVLGADADRLLRHGVGMRVRALVLVAGRGEADREPSRAAPPTAKPVRSKGALARASRPAKPAVAPKAVRLAKPVETAKGSAASKPVKAAEPAAPGQPKREELVRDSFTMPKSEYEALVGLERRAIGLTLPVKKSELLRAGVKALAAMSDAAFRAALQRVPALKTGRPAHRPGKQGAR